MNGASFVQDASIKTRLMIQRESRGPGDTRNAMDRISRRYGIPYSILWALRYRPPTDLFVSAYAAIGSAYEAELDRQAKLIEQQRATIVAKTRIGRAIMRAADALDGSKVGHVTTTGE